jgi:hypothetical protein
MRALQYSTCRDCMPCGDRELVLKSEVPLGMEIESCVAEKDERLLSSASSDQESLDLGHSSKKGRRVWFSCFPELAKSLRKKDTGSLSVFGSEQMVLSSRPLSVPYSG